MVRFSSAIFCILLALPLLWCGCNAPEAGTARHSGHDRGVLTPIEPRIFAIPGRTLVIPLQPLDTAAVAPTRAGEPVEQPTTLPAAPPQVTTSDGRPIESTLWWIARREQSPGSADSWLPPIAEWDTVTWDQLVEDPAHQPILARKGIWMLEVQLTPEIRATGLQLEGRTLRVVWLPEPDDLLSTGQNVHSNLPTSTFLDLGTLIRVESLDPNRRWRLGLITDRIPHEQLWGMRPPPPLASPILESVARQIEDRWRVAIGLVEQDDPETARALVHALTPLIQMPGDHLYPMWPSNPDPSLLPALLEPRQTQEARIQFARTWIARAAPALSVLIDDASGPDLRSPADPAAQSPAHQVMVGTFELQGRTHSWSAAPGDAAATTHRQLLPHRALFTPLEIPEGSVTQDVRVRVGQATERLPFLSDAFAVSPPGMRLAAFSFPWTAHSLLRGTPRVVGPDRATAVMLQQSLSGEAWEIYVECRFDPDEIITRSAQADSVRLYFGPRRASSLVLRIDARGLIFDETRPGSPAGTPVEINMQADRWSALIRLPQTAIESGRYIRLGIERLDSAGRRSTWPRPLLPEQSEPGRIVIDLSRWSALPPDSASASLPDTP